MEPKLKKALIEYIVGRRSLTLVGNPQVLAVIYEAAKASRELVEALNSGNIDRTTDAVESKRCAVERFERVTGKVWGI